MRFLSFLVGSRTRSPAKVYLNKGGVGPPSTTWPPHLEFDLTSAVDAIVSPRPNCCSRSYQTVNAHLVPKAPKFRGVDKYPLSEFAPSSVFYPPPQKNTIPKTNDSIDNTACSLTMPGPHLTHDEVCCSPFPPTYPQAQDAAGFDILTLYAVLQQAGGSFYCAKGQGSWHSLPDSKTTYIPPSAMASKPVLAFNICCYTNRYAHSRIANYSSVIFGTAAAVPSKEDSTADIAAILSDDDSPSSTTYPVIVRATDGKGRELRKDDKGYQVRKTGKKVKLSTVVDSDALDAFYARYAEICKAGMMALKPRDRTKNKRKTKGKKKKTPVA